MFDKMKNILELQGKMNQIKKELEDARIEGKSGAGQVKIVMDGKLKVHSIEIDDLLVSGAAKEQLKIHLLACLNDVIKKSQQLATEKIASVTGIKVPGL